MWPFLLLCINLLVVFFIFGTPGEEGSVVGGNFFLATHDYPLTSVYYPPLPTCKSFYIFHILKSDSYPQIKLIKKTTATCGGY